MSDMSSETSIPRWKRPLSMKLTLQIAAVLLGWFVLLTLPAYIAVEGYAWRYPDRRAALVMGYLLPAGGLALVGFLAILTLRWVWNLVVPAPRA